MKRNLSNSATKQSNNIYKNNTEGDSENIKYLEKPFSDKVLDSEFSRIRSEVVKKLMLNSRLLNTTDGVHLPKSHWRWYNGLGRSGSAPLRMPRPKLAKSFCTENR